MSYYDRRLSSWQVWNKGSVKGVRRVPNEGEGSVKMRGLEQCARVGMCAQAWVEWKMLDAFCVKALSRN